MAFTPVIGGLQVVFLTGVFDDRPPSTLSESLDETSSSATAPGPFSVVILLPRGQVVSCSSIFLSSLDTKTVADYHPRLVNFQESVSEMSCVTGRTAIILNNGRIHLRLQSQVQDNIK